MSLISDRIKISQFLGIIVICYYLLGASFWGLNSAMLGEILFLIGTILIAVGVIGRVWCLSYIAGNKRNKVIQHGPYSLCRNPLYLFSFIGAIGVGFATKTFAFPLMIFIVFVVYYPFVIRKEENDLKLKFGADFENYTQTIKTRFFPSFRNYSDLGRTEIHLRSFRKGIFDLIFFIFPLGIFPLVETSHFIGLVPFFYFIY